MFGLHCTVHLYVFFVIAPSTYMFCTVHLYVFFVIAPSTYMFSRHSKAPKFTYLSLKYPIAPSAYMVLHRPPIWFARVLHRPPIWFRALLWIWSGGGPAAGHLRLSLRKQNQDGHAGHRAHRRSPGLGALL